jgi:hypothetical protein
MSTDSSNVDTAAQVSATEADRINTGALGTLVAVGLLAMLSITAAITALVRHDIDIEEASKNADANQVVAALKASQSSTLNAPSRYVDRTKGLVSLPIDVAKGLVVRELEGDPNSATPAPLPKTDAGAAPVTGATVDSGAGGAKVATEPLPGAGKAPQTKPETGRAVLTPAPGSSSKPSPVPTPTPTAATPGAQAPGPTNK